MRAIVAPISAGETTPWNAGSGHGLHLVGCVCLARR